MLSSDVCDYNYAIYKGTIIVEGDNDDKTRNKKLFFKNNSPFRSWIWKFNNIFVDFAEFLMLLCQCIICSNIVTIVLWHQEVCGIVIEIK